MKAKKTCSILVLPGDNLKRLADDFGTTPKVIAKYNHLSKKDLRGNQLSIGHKIIMPLKSIEVTVTMPTIIVKSLDYYLKHGNVETADSAEFSGIDMPRASLIKGLLSAFGHKRSELADLVNSQVWNYSGDQYNQYVTINTSNPTILHHRHDLAYRLICAMVYRNIRIIGFFNPSEKQSLVKSHLESDNKK